MFRRIALRKSGLLGGLLAGVLLVGAAGCGTTPATPTAVPTPTLTTAAPTTEPTATEAVVPSPLPTEASTSTPEAVPTATTAAEPTTVVDPPTPTTEAAASPTSGQAKPTTSATDYKWTQVGLAGTNVTSLASFAQGPDATVLGAGPTGVWRSVYDFTKWDKLSVPLTNEGRTAGVALGSADVMYATRHTGCASGLPTERARSTDGGKTWTAIKEEAMSIAAANATVAYATTCSDVLKSTDGGATWTSLKAQKTNLDPNAVATSPDGQTVFVSYVSEGGSGAIGMSTDGGATWTDVSPKNAPHGEFTGPDHLTYVPALEGRPQDGGLYLTSLEGLWFLPYESTDWQLLSAKGPTTDVEWYTALFVDTAYSAAFDKPGPVIYVAKAKPDSSGASESLGVLRSLDMGKTWQPVGTGLGKHVVNSVALVPVDLSGGSRVETLLAGTDDGVWAITMK